MKEEKPQTASEQRHAQIDGVRDTIRTGLGVAFRIFIFVIMLPIAYDAFCKHGFWSGVIVLALAGMFATLTTGTPK